MSDIPDELIALAERLRKRAETERSISENCRIVADLLQPEMDKFDAREGPWNTYAVRMQIDHRRSAEKDAKFADDLIAAADLIIARASQ